MRKITNNVDRYNERIRAERKVIIEQIVAVQPKISLVKLEEIKGNMELYNLRDAAILVNKYID
jgi:hypothetical protein